MYQNHNLQRPLQIKIEESDICGMWEVVSISNNNDREQTLPVTRRIKYHFLEVMIYTRLEDGIPSHGSWKLSKKVNNGIIRYSLILCMIIEFQIVSLGFNELTISDGNTELTMVRRL